MSRNNSYSLLAVFSILLIHIQAIAQPAPSVYSAFGVGRLQNQSFVHNLGFGGGGYAYYSPIYMNSMNPAIIVNNDYTTFDAAFFIENKSYNEGDNNQTSGGGGLNYLSLGFPIYRSKWVSQIILQPYTAVNYSTSSTSLEDGFISPQQKSFVGRGGISMFGLINSFRIYKGLSLGIRSNYMFGSIDRSEITRIGNYLVGSDTISAVYRGSLQNVTSYSDFDFSAGLYFRHFFNQDMYISLGAVYEFATNLNSTRNVRLQKINSNGQPVVIGVDTLNSNFIVRDARGITKIPAKIGGGLTYGKRNKFSVSADVNYQDWREFEDYGFTSPYLTDSWSVRFGGEVTPDISSLNNYFKRATYRAGLRVEKSPFVINSTEIYDFGINFGASLPLLRLSTFNVAFELGQMGTNQSNLVRESYYKVHVGFSINDSWFIRQKLD
jgi:hypothetical protein